MGGSRFKDPLTSHGITDALRDAKLFDSAAQDAEAAFAYYAAQRDDFPYRRSR
jgi:hypothetical protein